MYQNCCKKCGSTDLYLEEKGSNTGLYCSDCGAWIKWVSKSEKRAFEHGKKTENDNNNQYNAAALNNIENHITRQILQAGEAREKAVREGMSDTYVQMCWDMARIWESLLPHVGHKTQT